MARVTTYFILFMLALRVTVLSWEEANRLPINVHETLPYLRCPSNRASTHNYETKTSNSDHCRRCEKSPSITAYNRLPVIPIVVSVVVVMVMMMMMGLGLPSRQKSQSGSCST